MRRKVEWLHPVGFWPPLDRRTAGSAWLGAGPESNTPPTVAALLCIVRRCAEPVKVNPTLYLGNFVPSHLGRLPPRRALAALPAGCYTRPHGQVHKPGLCARFSN